LALFIFIPVNRLLLGLYDVIGNREFTQRIVESRILGVNLNANQQNKNGLRCHFFYA